MNADFYIHYIDARHSLEKHKNVIQHAFEEAVSTVQRLLNLDKIDVVALDDPTAVIPELGIGGYTPTRNVVYLYINSLKESIDEREIYNTLCHEMYHARSYDGPGYGKTLLDSMLFEGLATAFEEEVSGLEAFLPKDLLNRSDTEELFNKYKKRLSTEDFDHHRWFIYDDSNEFPRWMGYQIGYFMVGEYLNKTNKKASQLVLEDFSAIKQFVHDTLARSKSS